MNYNHPQVGRAAVDVLEAAGFTVDLVTPPCCGRPLLSRGFLEAARDRARRNVRLFAAYASQDVPILGIEPSCLLALRDEYPDLVPGAEAREVAAHAFLVDEFLAAEAPQGRLRLTFNGTQKKVLFHGHCHQKALSGTARSLAVLRLPPGYTVEEVQSGCCGMAGAFGYETEHYELSLAMGRQRLAPAIQAKGPDWEVAVTGVSCRQQVEHLTGRPARHLLEVLRDALP
jgi:Fe-S oxidoreductase